MKLYKLINSATGVEVGLFSTRREAERKKQRLLRMREEENEECEGYFVKEEQYDK